MHQKATGQKDGYYPGEVNTEEEATIFSGGVKILRGVHLIFFSIKNPRDNEPYFISQDNLPLWAELRRDVTAFRIAPAMTLNDPHEQIKAITQLQTLPAQAVKETPPRLFIYFGIG